VLARRGLRVLRFKNEEIRLDLAHVLNQISAACAENSAEG
jgi:very-short-patch-repair endonuclease